MVSTELARAEAYLVGLFDWISAERLVTSMFDVEGLTGKTVLVGAVGEVLRAEMTDVEVVDELVYAIEMSVMAEFVEMGLGLAG